ncbi:hypothetical protein [Nissabacter sp. SGAir0207]|uniref:hypothetical protein n=1 Tax=Nissabacter sp. SGAir0207 TaxID=2126321 RepID=UPI0010CD6ADC|nr:hypothetical protein [Nissabacter sp. SGAir0207]QCR38960.1 hypothetical protein C1N62_22875 [Nissabacter sp. SGAir0207]
MHVTLPPLEEFSPADLREGTAAAAITRNRTILDCAAAIKRAGGTYSHEIRIRALYLDDGLRVDSVNSPMWDRGPSRSIAPLIETVVSTHKHTGQAS